MTSGKDWQLDYEQTGLEKHWKDLKKRCE